MLVRSLILFACFGVGAGFVARAERPEPTTLRSSLGEFPFQMGEWRGLQEKPLTPHVLEVLGVDDYLVRTYYTPERAGLGLYIGFYQSQRQGDTIHSPQNCLPGAGWEPTGHSFMPIAVADASTPSREIVVNRYVIRKGLDRQLAVYWYQAHGRVVASEYWAKYYLVRDAVRMNRTDGALVRITAPIASGESESVAERRVISFVKAIFPQLSRYIPV